MAALIMSLITNSIVTETHPAGGHDHAKYSRGHERERERERERSVGMTATVSEKVTSMTMNLTISVTVARKFS